MTYITVMQLQVTGHTLKKYVENISRQALHWTFNKRRLHKRLTYRRNDRSLKAIERGHHDIYIIVMQLQVNDQT